MATVVRKGASLDKAIPGVVCTQDPITNAEVNRLFDAVEALEFHAQEQRARRSR